MRLETSMRQHMGQVMVLAPRMIQSMEILQLPIMALQERMEQELQENPALERAETTEEDAAAEDAPDNASTAETDDQNDPGAKELVIDDANGNEQDFDRLEALSKDWSDHFNEEHRPSRNGMNEEGDKKHDAMQNMASKPQSLYDYLHDQVAFLDASPVEVKFIRFLIARLDENGRLNTPLEELVQS